MKLLYATSITYPSYQTNRLQIIQMSREFSKKIGENFILGADDVKNLTGVNIKNFKGTTRSYFLALKYLSFIKENNFKYIYCREEKLLFFIIIYNKLFFRLPLRFIYECHHLPKKQSFIYRYVLNQVDKIIVLNQFLKKDIVSFGVDRGKILVEPDAVDIKKFDITISKREAREKTGLPLDKNIILYSGLLYEWKGAQTLADASDFLAENDLVVFIGGKKHHVDKFKEENTDRKNISVLGAVPFEDVPVWLKSADVLVLPNSGKKDISKYHTSPMKLFEYMASGNPIVASDLPSIREVLNEKNSILVEADSSKKLAEGIKKVLGNKDLTDRISKQAFFDVKKYSWLDRTKHILNFIKDA